MVSLSDRDGHNNIIFFNLPFIPSLIKEGMGVV